MNLKEYNRIINKQRNLPTQLARCIKKQADLMRLAGQIGRRDILENPAVIDAAWEREVELAKLQGQIPAAPDRSVA